MGRPDPIVHIFPGVSGLTVTHMGLLHICDNVRSNTPYMLTIQAYPVTQPARIDRALQIRPTHWLFPNKSIGRTKQSRN